jgi:2-aminomuconate deaminase
MSKKKSIGRKMKLKKKSGPSKNKRMNTSSTAVASKRRVTTSSNEVASKRVVTVSSEKSEFSSARDSLTSKRAPEPVGPYPHARRVGDLIFVSGMGPRKPGSKDIPGVFQDALGNVLSYDIEAQTRSTIENIKTVLEDMGSGLEDVVDVQVFLTAMKADFPRFNKVYGEYFAKIGPTRTTVEILSLPTPIAVELKVIAHVPRK